MELELIKALQRQTAVLAQATAVLARAAGGDYEIVQVEQRSDWSDEPGVMVRIYFPDGPSFNVSLLDTRVLEERPVFLQQEPDCANREELAQWIKRRLTAEVG